jgi:hypothetical protein
LVVDVMLFRIMDGTEEDEPENESPGARPPARLMKRITYIHDAKV